MVSKDVKIVNILFSLTFITVFAVCFSALQKNIAYNHSSFVLYGDLAFQGVLIIFLLMIAIIITIVDLVGTLFLLKFVAMGFTHKSPNVKLSIPFALVLYVSTIAIYILSSNTAIGAWDKYIPSFFGWKITLSQPVYQGVTQTKNVTTAIASTKFHLLFWLLNFILMWTLWVMFSAAIVLVILILKETSHKKK